MARMATLHFSIALVLMTLFSDCAVSLRITPSDVPTSLLPLPARVTINGWSGNSHCQSDLEITSGGTGTPLACVRLIRKKGNRDIIHLSLAEGNCQDDNDNRNHSSVWPTAGGYSPDLYIRSEDNELVVTLNDRSQYKLSFPVSGTAQGLTVVRLMGDIHITVADAEVVGSCLSLSDNEAEFRVQKSDVILMKPKPNITDVEVRAEPYSTKGCKKIGIYEGKYQVQEQGWVRLELLLPKEEYSNINLTVNNQLVVTLPVSKSRCTGEEWYILHMTGTDKILNCDPGIAQNASKICACDTEIAQFASKICACKRGACDTCVWVIVVLIVTLVLSGALSVVVTYLNYKKKKE